MTVMLGVSMGAHAVRMALPRAGAPLARVVPRTQGAPTLEAPQPLFFKNQVIDTVDEDVEYQAAEFISAVVAESEPPMTTGVAYRDAHQADTLHRALEHQHLQNYHLVHEVEAVIEYLVASGEAAGYATVALYDLGSSGLNVSVVDLRARRVVASQRSSEFSGDLLDDTLRDNQLARLGKANTDPDMDLFERRCRVAKERLSSNDAVCLPDDSGMILLSRDSFETLISDDIDRSIEFARDVLIGAQVPIDAVVLIGGGSRIPLVRKRVGAGLDLPALTPNEPESVAARGAALSARPADVDHRPRPVTRMAAPVTGPPVTGPPVTAPPSAAAPESRVFPPPGMSPRSGAAAGTGADTKSGGSSRILTHSLPPSAFSTPTASASPAQASTVRAPAVPSSIVPSPSSSPVEPDIDAPTERPDAPTPKKPAALSTVYWLDADYEDDDGEDDTTRRRRRIRTWSIVGVVLAAVFAVSGFVFTQQGGPEVVDTSVTNSQTQAPATTSSVAPPAAVAPVVPLPPPAPVTTTPPPVVEAEPVAPPRTTVEEASPTQEAPPVVPAPVPAPAPAPEPPPLIPGLPGFTLPTLPPLFPPAP